MAAETAFNPADSLLNFMDIATSNIHEAMNSTRTKRKVNIRRFISRNVNKNKPAPKRLVTNGPKTATQTKPPSAAPTPQSDKCQPRPAQTNMQVYCNDRHHATESYPDAEINQILSDMCFDQPEIVSENYASPVSLEDQVMIAEYPYSPYSDCSEGSEWFDLAYPSPPCCSNAAYLVPPPQTDVCELASQRSPAYPPCACNPALDQGLPVTPTIFQVLDSFGW